MGRRDIWLAVAAAVVAAGEGAVTAGVLEAVTPEEEEAEVCCGAAVVLVEDGIW